MKRSTAGFTIAEVLIAVVVLSIGVVAMAGSSALVTRMIGRGQRATRAGEVAERRMDKLRLLAASTTPHCTALANGGPVTGQLGVTESWVVVAGAKTQTVTLTLSYKNALGKTHTDVVTTIIGC